MPKRFVTLTYDTTTPESAEDGDHEDTGFVTAEGYRESIRTTHGAAAGLLKAECTMTLREAVNQFGDRYGKWGLEENFPSFYQNDSHTTDFTTGEEERLALHLPRDVSASTFARVARLLRGA